MLDYPLAFYGGYLQLAGHKKDEFLHNKFVERLIWIIKQMQLDKKKILEDKEAVNNVCMMNFAIAQRDADRIATLSKQLNNATKELTLELKRQKEQKKYLYEEIRKRLDGLRNDYNKYRAFAEQEIAVKDAVIEKQSSII